MGSRRNISSNLLQRCGFDVDWGGGGKANVVRHGELPPWSRRRIGKGREAGSLIRGGSLIDR